MANKGFWVRVTSRFFLLTAVILLLIVSYSIVRSFIRRSEIEREVSSLQVEISKLKERNEQLSKLINYLGTEESKEKEARLQLGLQKPGENVVIIPSSDSPENSSNSTNADEEENVSNLFLWLKYFFGD